MSSDPPGFELPLLLLLAFRSLIDALHEELARCGHPDARPLHGFVCQAIGHKRVTAVELARRLGVSKQAAGKAISTLEQLGYVVRDADPDDARRKNVTLTGRGRDMLEQSASVLERLRAGWVETLGAERVREIEADLRTIAAPDMSRILDIPGWFTREK